MKLSVIIPCFNVADSIAVQLEALVNQNWSESWEVIIANNGSTDNTLSIAQQYQEKLPNLRIVDANDGQGPSFARNAGALAATGEALAFCDADDEVCPGWVAAMGEALSKYDFVAGCLKYEKLNEPWQLSGLRKQMQEGLIPHRAPPALEYAQSCNIGIKRSLHLAIGGFDQSLLITEDTEYCWRAQLAGIKLHFIPEAMVEYRHRRNLADIYRQARDYSQHSILLRQRYEDWSQLRKLKFIWGGWKQVLMHFVRIRNKGGLAAFIWSVGWKVGQLRAFFKYLV
ncbi:MAG: glycosyltransferase [Symploca sp. SIO2D2]|nr:glycosyltransferase [Symploca sp. SIO2D2]